MIRYYMPDHHRLPEVGELCTPYDIMAVCRYFGWRDLEKRISDKVDKLADFVSDGCSHWPDEWRGKNFTRCCIKHDIEYWVGGSSDERFIADCELAICVTKITGHKMAETMLIGVRAGGSAFWNEPYSWGFGLNG